MLHNLEIHVTGGRLISRLCSLSPNYSRRIKQNGLADMNASFGPIIAPGTGARLVFAEQTPAVFVLLREVAVMH